MATSKSGNKSVKQAETRRVFNMRRLRTMKEMVKQMFVFVQEKDTKGAEELLPQAYKAIDKATKRGVIKPNTAARKKSQLAKSIASIS